MTVVPGRRYASAVACLSVCLYSIETSRMIELLWLGGFIRPMLYCVVWKFRYVQK